jgi:antitoxin (DNA-binding transcriptional repressor) of toxin-antitoxin stability system
MPEICHDLSKWRFWRRFLVQSFASIGAIALVLEVINELFPKELTFRGLPWGLVILVVAAIYGLARSWPRPIEQSYSSPNTAIRIIKGDIFSQTSHLVIGICDTFDTQPPNIIARDSLQAQALDRLFGGDIAELDSRIDSALAGYSPVEIVQKPGKQRRYELGTIAVLTESGRKLFFAAYTYMNEHNQARGTADGIWKSLLNLWTQVSKHGNGEPVSITVIGGGQARIAQILPAQDSIRFIALSFMLASRHEKVCDELRIVVRPAEYSRLDRLELRAFLSSLRPS